MPKVNPQDRRNTLRDPQDRQKDPVDPQARRERSLVPYGRRIQEIAEARPDDTAIIEVDQEGRERRHGWSWLAERTAAIAGVMQAGGVGPRSTVVVSLPNGVEHLIASIAAWRLGAMVLPVSPSLPAPERDAILGLAAPALLVSPEPIQGWPWMTPADIHSAPPPADTIPDTLPEPGKAIGSGGSTGRPKIIVDPRPWGLDADLERDGASVGFRACQTQLVCGPLYHNSPFVWSTRGLLLGQTIVLMARFDAALAVDLIERHRVAWVYLAPTMMRRILRLPDIASGDLSSLEAVFHTAGPCPPEVKRGWIALVGPERIFESYGSTEDVGHSRIRGDDWLAHPGSVGRPLDTELRILGEDGRPVERGQVGEIFMRRPDAAGPTYRYIGAEPARTSDDGFVSVGDLGWEDEDGYLYLADRRVDMIVTGGANVYPAEVEAALLDHAAVADVAVIGLPDEEWGRRVHAVVELRPDSDGVDRAALDAHLRQRIASYKRPKTYDFVARLPRDESGKIRRRQLVDDRS